MIQKFLKSIKSYKFWLVIVLSYYVLTSSVYAVLAIAKFNRYFLTVGDLCIFNQGIWQYSKFKWPIITFHLDKPFLADHFHPILASLAPFYWIHSGEATLLFLQPFILLSTMIPIFLITYHLTKSILLGLALIFSYSLYLPVQYTLFFDFHEISFFPPLFAWAYYFFLKNKKFLVSFLLLLILLTKEELGFFVATFGLYLSIFVKRWRLFGLSWLILGVSYSLVIIYIVIPAIGGSYIYSNYGASGNSIFDVLVNIIRDPIGYFQLFYNSPIKQETLYRTFWPFAFLPIFSPLGLVLSLEQFTTRFIDLNTTNRWTIYYHYSAPMAVITVIGTINVISYMSKRLVKNKRWLIIFTSILLIVLTRLEQINASAVLLGKRPEFWQTEKWMSYIDEAIKKVDYNASVSAPKNIACHLSSRYKIYFFQDRQDMDYIILSNNGDFKNNFIKNSDSLYYLKQKKGDIPYQLIFHKEEVVVLKKKV